MSVCLFDVDGTLVDSREPILRALNAALGGAGLAPVAGSDLWRYVGPPLQMTVRSLLSDRGDDVANVDALIDAYRDEYQAISVGLARSYPGVPEMLDALADRVRLGVVTSKPAVYALPILEALDFASRMEVIEGPDLAELEPKTVTLERALARLASTGGVDVVMVGDRHHDVQAGQAHNVVTIGVTWGFGSRDELAQAGADYMVDEPQEITRIVSTRREN